MNSQEIAWMHHQLEELKRKERNIPASADLRRTRIQAKIETYREILQQFAPETARQEERS